MPSSHLFAVRQPASDAHTAYHNMYSPSNIDRIVVACQPTSYACQHQTISAPYSRASCPSHTMPLFVVTTLDHKKNIHTHHRRAAALEPPPRKSVSLSIQVGAKCSTSQNGGYKNAEEFGSKGKFTDFPNEFLGSGMTSSHLNSQPPHCTVHNCTVHRASSDI